MSHPCSNCPAFAKSYFSRLDTTTVSKIKDLSYSISFQKGKQLHSLNSDLGMVCIKSGVVRIECNTSPLANSVTLGYRQVGDLIGYDTLFRESPMFTYHGVQSGEGCFFKIKDITDLLPVIPLFFQQLSLWIVNDLFETCESLSNNSFKSVQQRVARIIVRIKGKLDTPSNAYLPIPLTRRDLAKMVGASVESVFRSLALLKARGLIEVKGQKIKVLDEEGLISIYRSKS